MVKDRFNQDLFSRIGLPKLKNISIICVKSLLMGDMTSLHVGQPIGFSQLINSGEFVDVVGQTIGRGFQGVVKRHDFRGAPASHGSNMGKRPGSSSSYRSQGKIIKNKKFPGHMGADMQVMKNLEVVSVNTDANVVLVKGSVPGKAGSLLCIRKSLG